MEGVGGVCSCVEQQTPSLLGARTSVLITQGFFAKQLVVTCPQHSLWSVMGLHTLESDPVHMC